MQLNAKQVKSFQALYQSRFGVSLSDEEAIEEGLRLIRMMRRVYRPITKEQYLRLYENEDEQTRSTKNL